MMTPTSVQDCLASSVGNSTANFVFATCQIGADAAIKQFILRNHSEFRLAFSRPGYLSFKSQSGRSLPDHPLIRLSGRVVAQVQDADPQQLIKNALSQIPVDCSEVHVFERDRLEVGRQRFQPGVSEFGTSVALGFGNQSLRSLSVNQEVAQPGTCVADIIMIEPDRWVVGTHLVSHRHESWPGGVPAIAEPPGMISRAYLKMAEAILWSQLPMVAGDEVVEIGSSPGGASQRLLDMGFHVTGVDPAEMDPRLLSHPNFEHWRGKSSAMKRKSYRKFKWLVADANVAPNYTLDCVGDIANYPTSQIAGMLLTLKLSSYELLDHLSDYLARIRQWGFTRVEARQLGHNRREICVVAARK